MSKSKNKNRVAVRRPNPTNASVTLVEYKAAPESKVNKLVHTCSICNKPFTVTASMKDPSICTECAEKPQKEAEKARRLAQAEYEKHMEGALHLNCVTCGKHFYITKAKQEKLKSLNLPLYTECYACQQAKIPVVEKGVEDNSEKKEVVNGI